MPYIGTERRAELDQGRAMTPGELNYVITRTVMAYVADHGLSYQTINDVVGALEGTKLEFYRRVASPYEDKKCAENGDVY